MISLVLSRIVYYPWNKFGIGIPIISFIERESIKKKMDFKEDGKHCQFILILMKFHIFYVNVFVRLGLDNTPFSC